MKLGDVCEINPKITPDDLDMNVSFIPMQRVSDQGDIDTSDIRAIKEVCKGFTAFVDGDILMAKITPCMENGKGAIASGLHNGIGYGSTEFHVLRPNQDLVRSSWIYYFTIEKLFRLNCEKNMTGSAGQKRVPKSYLQGYPIPLPSLAEQDMKIATLDRIRQIIILYKSQLQKLDNIVKARFVERFGLPGTDPYGWGLKTLGDCCELNPRRPKNMNTEVEYSFVAMPSVSEDGRVDTTIERPYTEVCKGFTYFAENDVLFAKITPCMENGKGGVAKGLKNGAGFGSTEFHVLRPIEGISDPYWLYIITMLRKFRSDAERVMTGTGGQRRVPITYLNEYKIALPPLDLQKQFAAFVRQSDKSKFAVQQALDKTQQLFDSLMQEYFG